MMDISIAIVGMACEYPDARSPEELWENVLARRRAFRRIPDARLRVADYVDGDPLAADRTYSAQAAVIEGYTFDRARFRVGGEAYRSADLAHWLALDVAGRALEQAGHPAGEGLPRESTGVFLGNTLTGEFSRANVLRLRWPFVRRVFESGLAEADWSRERRREFLEAMEASFKRPFPPIGEDSLAGGLSNTIAGRICNHHDFRGGGFTLDGACASSLLAVAQACAALSTGDLDAAVAGGVDLSLDPFELVGFAKAGALARDEMRVFDARSGGFWPGEGCGMVLLMRTADALRLGRPILAEVRGWGISSDGRGGITRPEVEGQLLALRRAYRRAGFGIETVGSFEGHGTGTELGDLTELRALIRARRESGRHSPGEPAAAIGSIKANIGHTKAAAGVAGLIKAVLSLREEVIPPATGCERPHPELMSNPALLRILDRGEAWPGDRPLRSAVSAMGFGGINAHLVLHREAPDRSPRPALHPGSRRLMASAQDVELILLAADRPDDLAHLAAQLQGIAPRLSFAEVGDLAARLAREVPDAEIRAAVVAARPAELADRLAILRDWIASGERSRVDLRRGVFLGRRDSTPRIGFLFPGQGVAVAFDGGALSRRFELVETLYERQETPPATDPLATEFAQPAIVRDSLAALRVLDMLGISAELAVGHSLGELTAYHWAGSMTEDRLLALARDRGRIMSGAGRGAGAMASLAAPADQVAALIQGCRVVIAGHNSPRQTVIAGETGALEQVLAKARAAGLLATRLAVSQAFHSPLMGHAHLGLAEILALEPPKPLRRTVYSTITGGPITSGDDPVDLLCRQLTRPVRFIEAIERARTAVDLWIEAGPGAVLTRLVGESSMTPAVSIEVGGPSLAGLLAATGAAFVLGAKVNVSALFEGRFHRDFPIDWRPRFFSNPCEQAPVLEDTPPAAVGESGGGDEASEGEPDVPPTLMDDLGQDGPSTAPALEVLRTLVARRVELPESSVADQHRFLHDLHLNSISVAQLIVEAARRLRIEPPADPTSFAPATVFEAASALEDLAKDGGRRAVANERHPPGISGWVRPFRIAWMTARQPGQLARPATLAGTDLRGADSWRLVAPARVNLAHEWHAALAREVGGSGLVACLPAGPEDEQLRILLEAARSLQARPAPDRFVMVQEPGGRGGGGFARTVAMEFPGLSICLIELPWGHPGACERIVAEAASAGRFLEVRYDEHGTRRVPTLVPLPEGIGPGERPLSSRDVVLVTGGGKGIAAECALELARRSGATLALMGRAKPEDDTALAANLGRLRLNDVPHLYVAADVGDAEAVAAGVERIGRVLGPITAVLHGAGRNVPRLLGELSEGDFLATLRPKVTGLRNVLRAIEPGRLGLLIGFGSIIARTGLRGEAEYAVANEWLTEEIRRFAREMPGCRCLSIEWSVWSGVGMGERLGRLDALARQGIAALTPEQGLLQLMDLVERPRCELAGEVGVVVAGRFGAPPTLRLAPRELPLLRFLENPRVDYPGIELVADATISGHADPYVADHVFQGTPLVPAVMGLEAMAQVALGLAGREAIPVFEDVRLDRPITVPLGGTRALRLAALASPDDRVDVAVRSDESSFHHDHFRASLRWDCADISWPTPMELPSNANDAPALPLDPGAELYGDVFFHGGRFRRIDHYRHLRARECLAEIRPASPDAGSWFGPYLPPTLLLGDPGVRDAVIHAIQACIPHVHVLPVGIERLYCGRLEPDRRWTVHARELGHEGKELVYEVDVRDERGRPCECWRGLRLRIVAPRGRRATWPVPLLVPYLERRLEELFPGDDLTIELVADSKRGTNGDGPRADGVLGRVLGRAGPITRGPNGAPDRFGGRRASASHGGGLTFAVAGHASRAIGCDLEPVVARPRREWGAILGGDRAGLADELLRQTGEDHDLVATRLWVAIECLVKAGSPTAEPLQFREIHEDGWLVLGSGRSRVASLPIRLRDGRSTLMIGVLTGKHHADVRIPACDRL